MFGSLVMKGNNVCLYGLIRAARRIMSLAGYNDEPIVPVDRARPPARGALAALFWYVAPFFVDGTTVSRVFSLPIQLCVE
jgi:hypothetical protein